MDLLKQWRRRAFGAAGAVVIAPVAIGLAAVVVGFGGGGIGGLRTLAQAFRGPEAPSIAPGAGGGAAAAESGKLLAQVESRERRAASRRATAAPGRRSPRTRTPAGVKRPATRPGGGTGPRPGGPAQTPKPSPTPAPTAQPAPSTVRQVGEQVHEVTDPIPVVGPPAGEVLDLIVDTVDQLPLP